ncbi:acyl-CoA dehydratase activase-related protein, partial [uncultured Negativibacillus sp.]|uniref:acyl-CoA dehydratase activase-related protein n=1 Tax=uncultured Negativibacillus sp. TaxID=1980696 RepID=UPI0025DF9169
ILYRIYQRHLSQVRQATIKALEGARKFLQGEKFHAAISGSAGLGLAEDAGIDFVQEVFATYKTVMEYEPDTDAVIELGGEDAKIIFLSGGLEERMNGSCAGGTGAFIDQMATLLGISTEELDELSLHHERIYPIASRCGVFAKTDIQPLLNQGAKKEDVSASIFQAVVDQTVTGLSQGRKIEGKVLFLGGPLFFFKGLQQRFAETLKLSKENAVFPTWAQYSVAIGTAIFTRGLERSYSYEEFINILENASSRSKTTNYLKPLFENEEEHNEFVRRHSQANVPWKDIADYSGDAYLGIDCGSTTTKLVLMSDSFETLYRYYSSSQGNPVQIVREQLKKIYEACGDRVHIRYAVSTGYGEELIQHAFHLDDGIVETIAHFKAAQHFDPKVEFILDIGGQDIKCFKIKNNAIDSIMLNEACSSGCGSFIETFAKSMGYTAEEFARLGLFSKYPVDLGSRCTVFMNSSVKQAQKDGASVEDISAGLSMSVVKNVLYKVIRARSADELGEHIVVQGGTFLNDAVLRSFEQEIGHNVTRPDIAGLMGAYGAAIYGRGIYKASKEKKESSILKMDQLENFVHESKPVVCQGCTNHCNLTINTFAGGERFISGNRCERPLGLGKEKQLPDLYRYKLEQVRALSEECQRLTAENHFHRGTIGLPLGLNMYENLFFWVEFFHSLQFNVLVSDISSRALYAKGQYSVPSDTACYPAKLMHGHIENLLDKGVDTIFYPCMSYNFDEHRGDNHFNCPVVAYYPELLISNVEKLQHVRYIYPYLNLSARKTFPKKIWEALREYYPDLTLKEVKQASDNAYTRYYAHQNDIKEKGAQALSYAREHGLKTIVLCGRPYHIDPEINHGINQQITSLGLVVVSEDCVSDLVVPVRPNVLNQWTYHSRLYNAAKYVTEHDDCELVQLVSFGCGIDAITTDEVSAILTRGDKLYTQLKIDEINNLGAVKIRLRSLIGAVKERDAQKQNEQ